MQIAQVEDVYRLSPLQQGMLAHRPDHPADDLDIVQLCAVLSGPLSPPLLEEAWNRAAARHTALRTSFRAEKLRTPFQVVQRQVRLPVAVHSSELQEVDIARFLQEDRARGIDPAQAPLVRLAVLRTGPEEHLLVCTHHRLILDGGSAALVLGEVLALYEALLRGEDPEPQRSRPLRESVDWLHRQDFAAAERFWRQELAGAVEAPLGSATPRPGRQGSGDLTVRLAASTTTALRSLGMTEGLSLATFVQGAWALLLARHTGRDDVLFGIEVAGRPAALSGAESLVGRFAHTLPLRVRVEPDAPLLAWLRRLDERRAVLQPYEHIPLHSGAPRLHSRLVVERFAAPAAVRGLGVREIQRIEVSPEPLTVIVRSGDELALQAVYEQARFDEPEVGTLLGGLRGLLESFAADPGGRLSEIAATAVASGGAEPVQAGHRLDEIVRSAHRHGVLPAETEKKGGAGGSGSELVPVPRDRPLPATFYQEWALHLEGVETNSIPSALRIEGRIDLAALRRSLTEIVRRHESLRTSFRWEAGEAYLVLAPPAEVPLPVIDLATLPEGIRTRVQQRLLSQHVGHVFDMARGPLFIAEVLRLGPNDHVLLMNVHHLVSDGWSIQVLQRELMVLYAAFSQGRPSPLPPLPIQLADFAHWQRRVFADEALAAQLAWWRKTLADLPPPPPLPIDKPRPEAFGPAALELPLSIGPEPAQVLRGLAQATHCSLPMLLLAALDALLYAYSGQGDLIVSLIFAARNRPELSGQIGLFMNTVPVRADVGGNPTFRQAAERVRDATIEAYAHQDVPFPRLLEELFPGRKLTRTILSGVCFNMLSFAEGAAAQQQPGRAALPGGLTLQTLGLEEVVAKHDLAITCMEGGGGVHFGFTGAADLFTPERLEKVVRDFEELLGRIVADPDVPLDELRSRINPA